MRDYELVLIINPEIGEERIKETIKEIAKLIASLKGKIKKTTDWGKRPLAHSISKLNQGSYFLLTASLPPEAPKKIDKKLKLQEEIIRYLIVNVEK